MIDLFRDMWNDKWIGRAILLYRRSLKALAALPHHRQVQEAAP